MYGVYVHIPWCRTRCPYCAFEVDVRRKRPFAAVTSGVLRDWDRQRRHFEGPPETLFFGGGTPSLHPAEELARVVAEVGARSEVSAEANPADLASFAGLAAAGVTRLSLGVQTFDPAIAARLGRRRDAEVAREALAAARAAGFVSVSIDLIFAVPGQTIARLHDDLETAVTLGADHLSLYGLTIEEGTAFARRRQAPAPDNRWRCMYDAALDALRESGFERYEVSNFARPGHRCVHNEHYWRARPWAGLGPSAHAWFERGTRTIQPTLDAWLADAPPVQEHPTPRELGVELVASTLRHTDGIDRRHLRALTGLDVTPPTSLTAAGLIRSDDLRVSLADAGFPLADGIASSLAGTLAEAPGPSGPARFVESWRSSEREPE